MNPCIFCGKHENLSKEHIFPRWLQRHLGISGQELIIYGGESLEPKQKMTFRNHVNRYVCQNCNNGWMSKLEQDALPILKALVDYQKHIILSQAEILSLAWWIWKTVLTLHSASVYEKVIPAHHYELAFNQKAPAHFMIHIAHLESRIDAPSWIQNQNWQGAERHLSGETLINALRQTYRITIGFGHLAARVMYFPLELPLFPLEEGIISIHPPSQDITWPPQTSINDLWELDRGVVVPQPLPPLNLDDTLANKQADQ